MREPVAEILAEDAEILVRRLERLVNKCLGNSKQLPSEGELETIRKIVDALEGAPAVTDKLKGDRKKAALGLLKSAFGNVPSEWHQNWEETSSDFEAQAEQLRKDCDELCTKMEADQSDAGVDELILQTLRTDDFVFDLASQDLRSRLAIDAMWGDRAGESKYEVLHDAQERLCHQAISSRQRLMSNRNYKVKKPLLNEGQIVYAYSASDADWRRATVKSHRELGSGHGYGPCRMYTVHFHHKPEPEEINDYEVNTWGTDEFDRAEFDRATVSTSNSGCIKRAFDENSQDLWAKQMGWFVALPGEEELHFSRYSDALAAYDTRVIERYGLNGGFEKGLIFDYQWDDYRERAHDKKTVSDQAKARCHFRQRVLFMNKHLPEGDMKLIGDVLVEMTAPDQLLMEPNGVNVDLLKELIGYVWRMARGCFLNGCEQSMRRSVVHHALVKDFANTERARIDALLMNYTEAGGDIDKFLSHLPHIGLIQYSCSSLDEMIEYLTDNTPEANHVDIHAIHPNGITSEWYVSPDSRPLQKYLKMYASAYNTTVKSLRLKYNGRAVFLSNIRDKSPEELGMTDGTLEVTFIQSTAEEEQSPKPKSQPSSKKSKGKKKKHRKSNKKRSTQPASFENEGEKLKEQHSQSLSRVFEEADATFRSIRQKLEAMNLERTLPKEKRVKPKSKVIPTEPMDNPLTDGLAGKAGKTHFIVQVGETNNLYNTRGSKQSAKQSAGRIAREVDLHGCTQEEALAKLDECLPEWVDTAMKGEYPWVITAKIVCGGGSQVLSEAVEGWIKRNPNVSNAPKNLYT